MTAHKSNLLIDALSPTSRVELLKHCKEVPLPVRTSLRSQEEMPQYAYFLTSGVASVVVALAEGGSAETSLIGHEGVTSAFSLLGASLAPTECFMQVGGSGYRMPFGEFRSLFLRSEEIRSRILECIQQEAMTTSQIAGCNKLHDAEARLARWLLMVQDRTETDSLQLTQEFLAQMLGTRRTTVALVAGTLQHAGLIEYSRGRVTIVSREKLEAAACECYGVARRLFVALYQPTPVAVASDNGRSATQPTQSARADVSYEAG